MSQNTHFLTAIETIALEAGNAILHLRGSTTPQHKTDGSPVTEADLTADAIIREGLAELTPDIPAITEETYDSTTLEPVGQYWCVDPLDGTKGFIHGGRNFTVNIALISEQKPILGVIYAPALGSLWAGGTGGATRRHATPSANHNLKTMGAAVAISARPVRLKNPDIVATKAHRSPELDAWIARLNPSSSVAVGSSLKFCVLAEGKADLYPRTSPTMEWDTAAGQAILEAAGGRVIGSDGGAFSYGKKGRINGAFAAIGLIRGGRVNAIPQDWLPPKG